MIDVTRVLVWPLVALMALIALRKPLAAMLGDVGKRATKFSVWQFAVELSTVPELAPAWNVPYAGDVRQLTNAAVFDSATTTLFEQLASTGASDYITVDLGSGDQWLTSRLYIFAVMLRRLRGLRCIVFTATVGEVRGSFVGWAEPTDVRWMLAMKYPWFETAYAHALATVEPGIMSHEGGMVNYVANRVVREFLAQIQALGPAVPEPSANLVPAASQAGSAAAPADWISLPRASPAEPQGMEHAAWITARLLEQVIGPRDTDNAFADSPDITPEKRAQAIARREGPFVALVNPTGRFKGLVDRQALLESIATGYAQSGEGQ